MSHGLEFVLASLESFLFGNTSGSADFEEELLGVLAVLNHGLDFGLNFWHVLFIQCYYYHSNNQWSLEHKLMIEICENIIGILNGKKIKILDESDK